MFKTLALLAVGASVVLGAPLERRRSGTATYYSQGGAAGSCGSVSSDSDYVVAVPAGSGHKCGDSIRVTSDKGSVTAKVADTCPGCSGNHIDLSEGAYNALGSQEDGVLDVDWSAE